MSDIRLLTQSIQWLQIAFGAPAALALLSKLDERLNFGPILERIILNFNVVSEYAWNAIGGIIDRDLSSFHGLLSFIFLSYCLIFRSICNANDYSINKKDLSFWIEIASLTVIFVIFISNFEFEDFYSFISVFIIYFIIVALFSGRSDFRDAPPMQALIILLAFTVGVALLMYGFGGECASTVYTWVLSGYVFNNVQ